MESQWQTVHRRRLQDDTPSVACYRCICKHPWLIVTHPMEAQWSKIVFKINFIDFVLTHEHTQCFLRMPKETYLSQHSKDVNIGWYNLCISYITYLQEQMHVCFYIWSFLRHRVTKLNMLCLEVEYIWRKRSQFLYSINDVARTFVCSSIHLPAHPNMSVW